MTAVAFVRATYTEENALSAYLVSLFGAGRCTVTWRRGRFQCIMPRQLSSSEIDNMHSRVYFSRYSTT